MRQLPGIALTYDDVLIRPSYSEVLPQDVDLGTRFSRRIALKMPLISSAMDTVTEAATAIVMAQSGGMGVIHKNLDPELQAKEVLKVKKYESGMIVDPITVHPEDSLQKVLEITGLYGFSGLPVVDEHNKLIGIITNRDLRFESNFEQKVKDIMTKDSLVTAPVGTGLQESKRILQKYRIEKLPVVDELGQLVGLITVKDIEKSVRFPDANKDSLGRLRVAAAVGVGDREFQRAEILLKAQVDALVIDTAHGHSRGVMEMLRALKQKFPQIDVLAGNVATSKACADLIKEGADGVKVGIGPGSICTTRVIAGIGVPQMEAVLSCREVCDEADIPYVADGGIKYSGDIVKALAGGASSVMVGSIFAGTDEAPGEMVIYHGRSYKVYRGMGSLGAMVKGSKDRYGQAKVKDENKLVPEGVEGQVPYRGSLSSIIYQLNGGIRSGMGYVGSRTIKELRERAEFIRITSASLREGHPHDVIITKESSNYSVS